MRPNRESLGRAGSTLLRRAARGAGYDLVRADFYSPIANTSMLAPEIWERQAPMPGLELDLDAQLRLIEQRLLPHLGSFTHLENPMYGPMDAHVLYAIVRDARPRRVLELGSGYSTLIIEQALAGRGGAAASHEVVDPHPSPLITTLDRRLRVDERSAAALPDDRFTSLEAGDILFVDTSHVIRPGGEVMRIVLEVLPALASGVLVHFHDIFRPFEYPRVLYDVFDVHWQEQYLVQAFLSFNELYTVLCANHALWRLRRELVKPLFPGLHEGMQPSAFWIVRR